MEKKDYIENIVQACNDVLDYNVQLFMLGGSIEKLYWGFVKPELIKNVLEKNGDELDKFDAVLQKLISTLRVTSLSFGDISSLIRKVGLKIYSLRYNIDSIKDMSSEDVLAIRSIMGQVKLLRDTLIWASNDKTDKD